MNNIGSIIMIIFGLVGAVAAAAQGQWLQVLPYTLLAFVAHLNAQQNRHIDWVNGSLQQIHSKTALGFRKVKQDMNSVRRELHTVQSKEEEE